MDVIRELTIIGAIVGTIFTLIAVAMKRDDIVDAAGFTLLVIVVGIVASCAVSAPWGPNGQ